MSDDSALTDRNLSRIMTINPALTDDLSDTSNDTLDGDVFTVIEGDAGASSIRSNSENANPNLDGSDLADVPDQDYNMFYNSSLNIQRRGSLTHLTYAWKNIMVSTGGSEKIPQPQGVLPIYSRVSTAASKCFHWKSKEAKILLNDVTGIVRPGELVAIMGASGSGKTTLLNALTFRNPSKLTVTGEFLINGAKVGPDSMTAISAYIQQDDIFIGSLTVRECLIFQAWVKMDKHIPMLERMERIEDIMDALGLTKCADVMVGIPGKIKGISGGEKKKLSFACEILTDPRLMFCDEPTSGLDSVNAMNVVRIMSKLTDEGRAIICTIHQPSSLVFERFDKVLLMAEGRVAYLGTAVDASKFFETYGYPSPLRYNLADFFIDTLAIRPGITNDSQPSKKICDAYANSEAIRKLRVEIDKKRDIWQHAQLEMEQVGNLEKQSAYKSTWCQQFRALMWRTSLAFLRDKWSLLIQCLQTVALAILIGIIFWGQKFDRNGVQNITGCLFLIQNVLTYAYCFAVIDNFALEQVVFFREHFNGMYRADVYFICKTIVVLPLYIFLPIVFTGISYYMIGLRPDFMSFLTTMLILVMIANSGSSFGFFISCLVPTISLALVVGPALLIPLMLFGGFFINSSSTPVYLIWIHYLSWFFYGHRALMTTQFHGVEGISNCTVVPFNCIPNGSTVLDMNDIKHEQFAFNIIMLAVTCVGYRILAYAALMAMVWRRM